VEQGSNEVETHEDTKKLSVVIVFLLLVVVALFGLAPFV